MEKQPVIKQQEYIKHCEKPKETALNQLRTQFPKQYERAEVVANGFGGAESGRIHVASLTRSIRIQLGLPPCIALTYSTIFFPLELKNAQKWLTNKVESGNANSDTIGSNSK